MRVRLAVLADYASVSLGDKLNIMGIFSNIMARTEPIVHPQMQLVVQFEFDPAEAGQKEMKIVLHDEDGMEILAVGGEMMVPRGQGGQPAIINQLLLMNGISFPKFGHYVFKVLINGRTEADIPLTVTRASEPQ